MTEAGRARKAREAKRGRERIVFPTVQNKGTTIAGAMANLRL
jgi:hypothetical protein